MIKLVSVVIGIMLGLTGLGTVSWKVYSYFETRYAKASEIERKFEIMDKNIALLQQDTTCQNIANQAWRVEERIMDLKKKYGEDIERGNEDNKEEYRRLSETKNQLLEKLNNCSKQMLLY